jgi:hypothetical protein
MFLMGEYWTNYKEKWGRNYQKQAKYVFQHFLME